MVPATPKVRSPLLLAGREWMWLMATQRSGVCPSRPGAPTPLSRALALQHPRGVLVPAFAHASPPFPPPSLMGAMIAGGEGVLPIQAAFFRTSLDPAYLGFLYRHAVRDVAVRLICTRALPAWRLATVILPSSLPAEAEHSECALPSATCRATDPSEPHKSAGKRSRIGMVAFLILGLPADLWPSQATRCSEGAVIAGREGLLSVHCNFGVHNCCGPFAAEFPA